MKIQDFFENIFPLVVFALIVFFNIYQAHKRSKKEKRTSFSKNTTQKTVLLPSIEKKQPLFEEKKSDDREDVFSKASSGQTGKRISGRDRMRGYLIFQKK